MPIGIFLIKELIFLGLRLSSTSYTEAITSGAGGGSIPIPINVLTLSLGILFPLGSGLAPLVEVSVTLRSPVVVIPFAIK